MDLTIKFPTYIENSIQAKGVKGDWFLLWYIKINTQNLFLKNSAHEGYKIIKETSEKESKSIIFPNPINPITRSSKIQADPVTKLKEFQSSNG